MKAKILLIIISFIIYHINGFCKVNKTKPKYSYSLKYINIDTIKDVVYLKVGVLVKQNSCFGSRKIPYPVFVTHLRTEEIDSFAYTSNKNLISNLSLYILDSNGTKFYLHPAFVDCGSDFPTLVNKYIYLKNNDSTLIELLIDYKYLNNKTKNQLKSINCYKDGRFYEKIKLGDTKINDYKKIVIGSTVIYNEFKCKNTIYYGSSAIIE
jgi:hypothetical protein